jgi:NitT/TauT family transport system permease protein
MSRISELHKGLLGAIPFVALLLAWQTATFFEWVQPYFLPTPRAVVTSIYELVATGTLWIHLTDSAVRIVLGFVLAMVTGIPIGILFGIVPTFRRIFEPFNNFFRYTPLPAFIPLVIMWVGIGTANPVTLVFLSVFWPLIVLVGDSVSNVPFQYIEMARTLGLRRLGSLFRVIVPASLPGIFDALRVSAGFAWASVILAEISGATTGLGHILMEAQRFLNSDTVIGGIILLGTLGVLTDLSFSYAYRILFPWTERERRRKRESTHTYATAS